MTVKIAMISEHASPLAVIGGVDSGGQNVYVANTARNLASSGYEVDIFTRRDNPNIPEIYQWQKGVRVIHVPAGPPEFIAKEELLPYMDDFTHYMIDFIKHMESPYKIIHAHFWMSALVAANLKQKLGLPFVVTFHALGKVRRKYQGTNDHFPDIRFDVEERIVKEADRIIAECPQDEHDLRSLYMADPDKLVTVPCGFDPAEMWPLDKALSRKFLGIPEDERVVLQLGRIVPRKGIETVLKGFSRMVKDFGITGKLFIVGGETLEPDPKATPEIGRLQKIAAEEGLEEQVIFIGQRSREELKHYYSAADVFVSTPWYEPFGITPVEAMACGTPVIGSKVGGIKYTVAEGETGYLIPPDDSVALADRLAHLFRNPGELKLLGQNGVRRANNLFTWQKVSAELSAVYEEVTGLKPTFASIQKTDSNGSDVDKAILSNQQPLDASIEELIQVLQLSKKNLHSKTSQAAEIIASCLARGNKVMVCGNGGSAAEAQHFASEFVGQFSVTGRQALPVMSLTPDSSFLTAWSNDVGYDTVFSRQVEAFGQPGDVLLGISTSGKSHNIIEAFKTAASMDIVCIGLIGRDGGDMLSWSDIPILIPSSNTQRIQEMQLLILHSISELVENRFVPEGLQQQSSNINNENNTKKGWGVQSSVSIRLQKTK
jgi:D-inositol-3-phosphate glycosyltransferase